MSLLSIFANDNDSGSVSSSFYDNVKLGDDIAVLDVGSYNVTCMIANLDRNYHLRLKAYSQQATKGMRSGVVVNLPELISSISIAVHNAEQMAKTTIDKVFVNLPPQLSASLSIDVSLHINGAVITKEHIKRIIVQACGSEQFKDREIIHAISHSYVIDSFKGIIEPIGMTGKVLSAKVLVISTKLDLVRNLVSAISKSHLDIIDFVDGAFASGLGVLVRDEMELGTIVIDMGASTTSFSIFNNGNLIKTGHVKIGSWQITSDLAKGLSTTITHAERVKNLYGSAILSLYDDKEQVTVPTIGVADSMVNQKVPKSSITQIIKPRVEETLIMVKSELEKQNIKGLRSYNIVITGGGSQLAGVDEVAGLIFGRHVRVAKPMNLMGITKQEEVTGTAELSTVAGMLEYARLQIIETHNMRKRKNKKNRLFAKLGLWLRENL